jgi:hypothetical protein
MRSFFRVSLLVSTATVLVCWIFELADSCDVCLFPHLRSDAEAVARFRQQRDAFVPRAAEIVDQLGAGQTSLREASTLFCQIAAQEHPTYLKALVTINEFANIQTKAAHDLLDDVFRKIASDKLDPARAEQLEREFETILAEDR